MPDLSSALHLAASELTLAVGALVLLMVGAFIGDKSARLVSILSVLLLIAAAVLLAARGAWLPAAALAGAGLWLTLSSRQRAPAPRSEALTVAEARSLLGVTGAATPAEINAAWKRLMARAHPDHGGTEGLASRLNAARDRLLKP